MGKDLWSAETLPALLFFLEKRNPTMLDGEMKNSRVPWKVRDTEKWSERDGLPEDKKKFSCSLAWEGGGEKTRVGERKPLFLKLPSTVSRSSVSSYYQCQSAFMGHYEPDMLSVPESLLLYKLFQFTSKFIAQEKD